MSLFTKADAEEALGLIDKQEALANKLVLAKVIDGFEYMKIRDACDRSREDIKNKLAMTTLVIRDANKMKFDMRFAWVILRKNKDALVRRGGRAWMEMSEAEVNKLKAAGVTLIYSQFRKREDSRGVNLLDQGLEAATFDHEALQELIVDEEQGRAAQELGYMVKFRPSGEFDDRTAVIYNFNASDLERIGAHA